MLGFPFNNDSRGAREQLQHHQQQQHHHQQQLRQARHQHQPTTAAAAAAAAFALGLGAARRTSGERKENTVPLQNEAGISERPSAVISSSAAGTAWDVDESLPPLLDTPRLRSVSSLVLSSDGEPDSLPLAELGPGYPRPRSSRENPGWNSLLEGLASSLHSLPPPPPPLQPLLASAGSPRLQREPSFPPPSLPPNAPRSLTRAPSFPPLQDSAMTLGSQSLLSEPMSDWRTTGTTTSRAGGALGSGGGAIGGPRSSGSGGSRGGEGRVTRAYGYGGDGVHEERGHCAANDQWNAGDGRGMGGVGSGGCGDDGDVGDGGGSDGLYSCRPTVPGRRPSFDQLALMIPGIPQTFSPSKAEAVGTAEEKSRVPAPTKPAPSPRGRPTSRPESVGRRKSRGEDGPRAAGSSRSSKTKNGSKLQDVAGSAGPASKDGGPIDLEKKARRDAAIKRYLHKRSRRKFANSTREASPSRSRPKAARIRPRKFGKFVKIVPDFIPVTAVVTEGGGDGDFKPTNEAAVVHPSLKEARRGRGVGASSRVKEELLAPIDAGSLHRSAYQQQSRISSGASSSSGAVNDFTSLWQTTPM